MAMIKKWGMKIHFLKPWFASWYNKRKFDKNNLKEIEQCQLIYPCWSFDHASGFAIATQFLAYNSSRNITESNPTEFDLHIPHRIICEC